LIPERYSFIIAFTGRGKIMVCQTPLDKIGTFGEENILPTILPLSPGVNAALIAFAMITLSVALICVVIALAKTGKIGKGTKKVTSIVPVSPPTSEPGVVSVAPMKMATFDVSDLAVSPLEAKEWETVTVSFRVTNTSYVSGYYRAELKVNDKVVFIKALELAPQTTKLATLYVVETKAGEYKVKVGGLEGKVVVC
jgi:hypothetical protein